MKKKTVTIKWCVMIFLMYDAIVCYVLPFNCRDLSILLMPNMILGHKV
jgi:hypothetical protein